MKKNPSSKNTSDNLSTETAKLFPDHLPLQKLIKLTKRINKINANMVTTSFLVRQGRIKSVYTMGTGPDETVEDDNTKPIHSIICVETFEYEEESEEDTTEEETEARSHIKTEGLE